MRNQAQVRYERELLSADTYRYSTSLFQSRVDRRVREISNNDYDHKRGISTVNSTS